VEDQPRFLARVSGYQRSSVGAIDQLEAVDELTQERLSAAARRRERARVVAAWSDAHATIEEALTAFLGAVPSKQFRGDVRYVRHGLGRLDRRVRG
jgi:hypothetical protein